VNIKGITIGPPNGGGRGGHKKESDRVIRAAGNTIVLVIARQIYGRCDVRTYLSRRRTATGRTGGATLKRHFSMLPGDPRRSGS